MKQDFSLSSISAIASVKSRHGSFAVDFGAKDSKNKLTIMYVDIATKKLTAFAEIPVMPRQEVIKVLNILGSYAKACEKFESKRNPAKLLLSHQAFVDLLTGRTAPKSKKKLPLKIKKQSLNAARSGSDTIVL